MSEHSEEQPATPNQGDDSSRDETATPGNAPASDLDSGDRHEPVEANGPVADRLDSDDLEPY